MVGDITADPRASHKHEQRRGLSSHLLSKLLNQAVTQSGYCGDLQWPYQKSPEGCVTQGVEIESILEMIAIGREWNRKPLDRTFIKIDEEDEIGLTDLVGNFKEVPFLNSFSDLPFSIKIVINIVQLSGANRHRIGNYGREQLAKRDYVHGLPGLEGQRGIC
jgi:hypothetical protein